ncbi:hypothetical protein Anapl_08120 [Anas platyrhynchos]|uniref:Uncharacterized protein n=1 Tax=Anas platyrhynchos TaxID=8839 RepID=R0KEM0_ANAPL|nr:hypothetical protein Anapl_08120 [Anas platyrhynchos]
MAFMTLPLAQPHAKLFHTCKRSLNSTFKHKTNTDIKITVVALERMFYCSSQAKSMTCQPLFPKSQRRCALVLLTCPELHLDGPNWQASEAGSGAALNHHTTLTQLRKLQQGPKRRWKTEKVRAYFTSNAKHEIIDFNQVLKSNLKYKLVFKACFITHQVNFSIPATPTKATAQVNTDAPGTRRCPHNATYKGTATTHKSGCTLSVAAHRIRAHTAFTPRSGLVHSHRSGHHRQLIITVFKVTIAITD